MADKRVEVLTRFRADSGALDRSVRRSALYAKNLNDRITAVTGSVLRMASTAASVAGFAGVGYVVAKTAKDMVGLNRELETAKIGIATILQQQSAGGRGPFEGWSTALKGSADTIRELEKRAAVLPGTTDEFRRGFELLLPVTSKAGQSINETIELAEKALLAAKMGNVSGGTDTVARDIRQILSGSASVAEISTIALQGRAGELAKLAKKDRGAALREITKILKVSDAALKAYAGTFEAQTSTLQDNITRFVRTAGEPVFEWVTKKLADWNAWLAKNETRVKEIAKTVGEKIVKGIKTAGEWAKKLYDHWDDIKAVIRTVAEVWIATKLVTAIARVTAAITAAGGLAAAIRSMLGPVGILVAGFEVIRDVLEDMHEQEQGRRNIVDRGERNLRDRYKSEDFGPNTAKIINQRLVQRVRGIDPRPLDPEYMDLLTNAARLRVIGMSDYNVVEKERLRKQLKESPLEAIGALLTDAEIKEIATPLTNRILAEKDFAAKSQFKLKEGSFGGIGAKLSEPAQRNLLRDPFKAEDPPNIDARGSTFNFNQKFEEGDPERIFFEIRSALIRPFVPKLGSTLAPS